MTFGEELTTKVSPAAYRRLAEASEYYAKRGFKYIDVPWMVQQKVCNSTKPKSAYPIHHHVRSLNHTFHIVASAEQSFLQLQFERAKFNQPLMQGRYQTITPCFRDEEVIDDLHRMGFIKLELIDWSDPTQQNLAEIVSIASQWFTQFLPVTIVSNELWHESGVDIQSKSTGIELGSYGIRKVTIGGFDFQWIYATGLAEPRLSHVISVETV